MFATIYLPNFYLQAATRHQPELRAKPVALIEKAWHSEPVLRRISRVIQQLDECQIRAQASIAPTADTSFLAAHLARPVLQVENAKEFLGTLSIETLATCCPASP